MDFETLDRLYHQPLFDLILQSRKLHVRHWRGSQVQRCSLLSIKTGGCSEDCSYCAQSAHYSTGLEREELLPVNEILAAAERARAQGATRFCMGAAWRGARDGTEKFAPLAEQPPVDNFELVRLIAVARLALPKARVRLAAGRTRISREGQALCFFAGADSIFYGNKLLTAENPAVDTDVALLRELGLHIEESNDEKPVAEMAAISKKKRWPHPSPTWNHLPAR